MPEQLDLFAVPPAFPAGFKFQREVISLELERELVERIRELPLTEFEFHGYVGKRRTLSYGAAYDFATERLQLAESMPLFLEPLREAAAAFAGIAADKLAQTLVTEYAPGAGIGWHRDKGVFGDVVGISLHSACQFRLRRKRGDEWERVNLTAEPRSAYLLSGPSRTEWEHSIPEVETLRYSVTFRTVR
jgi:alkylated DNA repair dioxygenase AlkB